MSEVLSQQKLSKRKQRNSTMFSTFCAVAVLCCAVNAVLCCAVNASAKPVSDKVAAAAAARQAAMDAAEEAPALSETAVAQVSAAGALTCVTGFRLDPKP